MAAHSPLNLSILALIVFATIGGTPIALAAEERAYWIIDDPFDCATSPDAQMTRTCARGDFIIPHRTRWNELRTRLWLETKDHREFWTRGSQVRLYLPSMDSIVAPSPSKNNGTPIATEPEPKAPVPAAPVPQAKPLGLGGSLFLRRNRGKDGPLLTRVAAWNPALAAGDAIYGFGGDPGEERFENGARLEAPDIEDLLNTLLVEFNSAWPTKAAPPPKVIVIASSSRTLYSGPQGIFVPIGFLSSLRSDEELEFALAHELAHFKLGHFTSNLRGAYARLLSQIRQTNKLYLAIEADNPSAASISDPTPYMTAIVQYGRYLTDARAARDEDDADSLAVDLLYARRTCGLDAALAMLTQMQKVLEDDEVSSRSQAEDLARRLVLASGDSSAKTAMKDSEAVKAFARASVADSAAFLMRRYSNQLTSTSRRAAQLKIYVGNAYPRTPANCAPVSPRLDQIRGGPSYLDAVRTVAALDAAAKVDPNKPGEVLLALEPALKSKFHLTPIVVERAAAAYRASGDFGRARALLERAISADAANGDVYAAYASLLTARGDYERAQSALESSAARLNDGSVLLPQRIVLALRRGKLDVASEALGECMIVGEATLRKACMTVLDQPNARAALAKTTMAQRDILLDKLKLAPVLMLPPGDLFAGGEPVSKPDGT